jgi:hypothetical protein
MALDNAKNFAKVTVSTGYDASATSVVLQSGDGAKLPTVPFNVVWYNATDYSDPGDDPNVEIVRVTAISTDTLTVTRAQEGISASTKNTASKTYKMIAGLTAKGINTDWNKYSDGEAIKDESGNEQVKFSTTASAVNEFTVKNAATGNGPQLQVTGGDTNIDLKLVPKGTGRAVITSGLVLDAPSAGIQFNDASVHTINAGSAGGEIRFQYWNGSADLIWMYLKSDGNIGIGPGSSSPTSTLHLFGASAAMTFEEATANPSNPTSGSQMRVYMKADKFVIQYNDGGTTRYKTLTLSGTGTTWAHSTSAP